MHDILQHGASKVPGFPNGDPELLHHVLHGINVSWVDPVSKTQACEQREDSRVDTITDDNNVTY